MEVAAVKPRRISAAEKLRDLYCYPWLRRRLMAMEIERVDLADLDGGNVLALEFDPRWQRVTAIVRSARYPQQFCRYLSFRVPADEDQVRAQAVRLREGFGFPVDDATVEKMLEWTRSAGAKLTAAARR